MLIVPVLKKILLRGELEVVDDFIGEQIIETTDNHPFWGEGIKDGSLQMNYR